MDSMRKTLAMLCLVLFGFLSFTAHAAANYVDGIYYAYAKGFGGDVAVEITIQNGCIADVKAVGAKETQGIGTQALTKLPDKIIAANGVENVDTIASATITSKAVLDAASQCLEQARTGISSTPTPSPVPTSTPSPTPQPTPPTAHPEYHDGAYTAQAAGFGGTVTVSMTILEGWIVEVETEGANEIQAIGGRALAELPDKIIAANGVENVDAIASATITSKAVLKAAAQCLEQAVDTTADDLLSVIRIPEGVQIIEKESFCHTAAVFIVIPNGCKEIESRAFAGNADLRWVLIPSSVQQIAEDAFADCGDYQIFVPPNSNEYTDASDSSME